MITPDILAQAADLAATSGLVVRILADGGIELRPPEDTRSPAARRQAAYRDRKPRQRQYPAFRHWQDLRRQVFARDSYACTYCGSDGDGKSLHCDHVLAVSRGGSHELANLTTACQACNTSKRDREVENWRPGK